MAVKNPKTTNYSYLATGKRKTAIAKVWVAPEGAGRIWVNGKTIDGFFGNHPWQKYAVRQPLVAAKLEKADVKAWVMGGGTTGQADAIKLGVARAVAQMDTKLHRLMRQTGYLTRDSRIVERKKPGQPKARKRFQFSKR